MQPKKMLIAIAVTSLFSCSAAFAGMESGSASAADNYPGWGPIANLETPYSPNESAAARYDLEMHARDQHFTEVAEARQTVWVANAPLRMPVETAFAAPKQNLLFAPFRSLARLINPQEMRAQQQD